MQNENIFRSVGVINRVFTSFLSKEITELQISYSDSIFLMNIGEREGISQEEISNQLAIDKAAVARSIKSMNTMGLVRIESSILDKRRKHLYLTNEGKIKFDCLTDIHEKWSRNVLQNISKDELNTITIAMEDICKHAKTLIE